jgi:hypothetical protein
MENNQFNMYGVSLEPGKEGQLVVIPIWEGGQRMEVSARVISGGTEKEPAVFELAEMPLSRENGVNY